MEKAQIIAYIIFACVGIVAYIITTVLAIKRKKANGEQVNADEVFADIAEKVIGLIKSAESAFASVNKGGALKLKDVLNDTKDLCESAGIAFDKGYWTDFIGKAVDLINFDRKPAEVPADATKTTI